MGPITTWLASLGIPAGLWFINLLIRAKTTKPLTAGADWLLLLIAFDFAAILAASDFQKFVHYKPWSDEIAAVLFILSFVAAVGWIVSVFYIEPAFGSPSRPENSMTFTAKFRSYVKAPWRIICHPLVLTILVFGILVSVTAVHIFAFLFDPN